jgi:sulfane dehydrogenase subunit SoxC
MTEPEREPRFPPNIPDTGLSPDERYYPDEVLLANRNKGMPLEALQYDTTPTGMHYLLVHFDVPLTEADGWTLTIDGLVDRPLTLSLADIKSRPAVSVPVTMECAGNGRALLDPRPISQPWRVEAIGTAEWTGTPLRDIVAEAGVKPDAVELVFTGRDRGVQGEVPQAYQRSLNIDDVMREEVLLAYEMNGRPLEPQHGYPLRLLVPGWYGMTSVKWLESIEAVAEPFEGYQMMDSYRYSDSKEECGEAVTTQQVRALVTPPGVPDFFTRQRLVQQGRVTLTGRAWAGRNDVTRVEVSADGGKSWEDADLGDRPAPYAWRAWSYDWLAAPGRHILVVRASDSAGNSQPVDQPWNYQGMGVNVCQRVEVLVE